MTSGSAHTRFPTVHPYLENDHITRIWVAGSLLMIAFAVIIVPALIADTRTLNGVNVWYKPLKFSLSLALHFITLAILAQQLPRKYRAGITMSIVGYAAIAAMLFEQVYITVQAARGRRSHFNFETQFEASMYALMGVGAVLLVLVAFVLGIMIWRKAEANSSGYRLGSILGLLLGSTLTLVVASYMSSSSGHWVGEATSDVGGVPIFGWSREVGDLRVSHFFATHIIQTLPMLGLAMDRLNWRPRSTVWVAAVVQVALVAGLFVQAVSGRPVWPL